MVDTFKTSFGNTSFNAQRDVLNFVHQGFRAHEFDRYIQVIAQQHNLLFGLQGGVAGQYYHLTLAQHTALHAPVTILDSTSIDFTLVGQQITAVVLPGGVDHNALLNYNANRHIDHTAVSIIAGTGMAGGGTIDANRTLNCTITQYTDVMAVAALTGQNISIFVNDVPYLTAEADTLQSVFDRGQSITIANTDNQTLSLTQNDTTNNPNAFNITNAATHNALYINQTGVNVAPYHAVLVYSNTAQTGDSLIKAHLDNAGSDQEVVTLYNDGTGACMYLEQNGNGIAWTVQNNGTDFGMNFQQVGILAASKNSWYIYSNAVQVNSALAYIFQDNAASSANCFDIRNDGTGYALFVDYNSATNTAVYIDSEAMALTTTGKYGARFDQDVSSGYGLYVERDIAEAGTFYLVQFNNENAADTAGCLSIKNDGTGYGQLIDQNGDANALTIMSDTTTKYGIQIYCNGVRTNRAALYIQDAQATTSTTTFALDNAGTGPDSDYNGLKSKRDSVSVADDGTITLATGVAGWLTVMFGDNEEKARLWIATNGSVEIESSSLNFANTDTDNKACVYDGGSGAIIKNRLGGAKTVRYIYFYS